MSIATEHTARLEIRRAIFAQLNHDPVLVEHGISNIFDDVPDNQPYPYVCFGEITERADTNTQRSIAREVTTTIHIWSRTSRAQVDEISNRIIYKLEGQELVQLGVWQWTYTVYEFAETMKDPDGITFHGVVRFRFRVRRIA